MTRPPRRSARALVVYDGECGFCTSTARRLRRLDRAGRLRFRPLQDDRVYAEDPRLDRRTCERTVHLVAEDGTIHAGGAALREAAARVGAGRVTWILALPVARQVTEAAYRLVARNRSWIPL